MAAAIMSDSSSFYCIRAFITTWSQKGDKSEGGGQRRACGVQCVLTVVGKKVRSRLGELASVVRNRMAKPYFWCLSILLYVINPIVILMSDVIVFLSNFETSTLPLPSVSLWASLSQGGNVSERSERGQQITDNRCAYSVYLIP